MCLRLLLKAERIVASFNACEGIPTETLESDATDLYLSLTENDVMKSENKRMFGVLETSLIAYEKTKADKSELLDALRECLNQIEYLHGKFKKTGTNETVISRTQTILQKFEK